MAGASVSHHRQNPLNLEPQASLDARYLYDSLRQIDMELGKGLFFWKEDMSLKLEVFACLTLQLNPDKRLSWGSHRTTITMRGATVMLGIVGDGSREKRPHGHK